MVEMSKLMMLAASLSLEGFKCRFIEMSQDIDYIEVANPISRPHWIKIHNRGNETFETLDWDKYCSSCRLKCLLTSSKIHTTWFIARRKAVNIDIVSEEKNYGRFIQGLNKEGINFTVSRVRRMSNCSRSKGLTVNQFYTVRLALDNGYYDSPKRTDMKKLSKKLGCSPSTLCETLRRAEKKIIEEYVDLPRSEQPEQNHQRIVAPAVE
ncbi:MAG: helix-turn-helix domain-containing protein [Nitrososphaerota archaeon]|nr:helix-turn-helix domain-containing protein [Nitrososphaerota archaeon]